MIPDKHLTQSVRLACEAAGRAILEIYATQFAVVSKDDASPVTAADLAADRILVATLQQLTPDIPVVSEERAKPPLTPGAPFWLVDPLDGTREFVARNGEFTVNAGLIVAGRPVLGVVHIPVEGTSYTGLVGGPDAGALRWRDGVATPIACRAAQADGLDVAVSRSHNDAATEAFLAGHKVRRRLAVGSSLKFCRVAEGMADLYPRHGPTNEWDTAAGHAVAVAAGAEVTDWGGAELRYGKPGLLNAGFVVWGRRTI
jgi:3'(2'), 5'-bisphosphate nucleotidase